MKFKDLVGLTSYSSFALINHKAKKVSLFHSQNTLVGLARIINDLKNKQHKNKHLIQYRRNYEFIVLESYKPEPDDLTRILNRYSLCFFETHYKELGYEVFMPSNSLRFQLTTVLNLLDGVHLNLVNKAGNTFKCGIFDNIDEVEEFRSYINNRPVHICALNERTREFYSSLK